MKRLVLSLAVLLLTPGHILLRQAEAAGVTTPPGLADVPPCADPDLLPDAARVPCGAILTFRDGLTDRDRSQVVTETQTTLRFDYQSINAAAVVVSDLQSLSALREHPDIVEVIPDRPVSKIGNSSNTSTNAWTAQVVPSGVKRMGAAPGSLTVTGAGVGIAIVDTGLDLPNADLSVSPKCFTAYSSCQDGDGHGTHVGGIAAAVNNTIGTVGVAPGAKLYAVKALNDNGSGTDSAIIAGLNWVAQNANGVTPPIRVVNMSLGRKGSLNDNNALHDAVRVLTDTLGITVVVAAGNDASLEVSGEVPATYPEVLAIASTSALDGTNACRNLSAPIKTDTASYFTTDGAFNMTTGIGVTISAPGEDKEDISRNCFLSTTGILSTRLGGGTTRMSGTSMASPHVAGLAALVLQKAGGSLSPESMRTKIRTTASRAGVAPLNSPSSSYGFDGEREGIASACRALGLSNCP